MSSERHYWRSDPGSEPVLLPSGWEQHIKGDEPPRSRLARFLKRQLMKNEAANRYFEAERLSKRALADQRTLPAARAAGSRTRHVTVTATRDTGATIVSDQGPSPSGAIPAAIASDRPHTADPERSRVRCGAQTGF